MESRTVDITVTAGTHALVTVTGDLDLGARQDAEEALAYLEGLGVDDIDVDLRALGYLDSTGASMLLTLAHRTRRRGGRVRLRNASKRVLFLLDVRGGMDMFERLGAPQRRDLEQRKSA